MTQKFHTRKIKHKNITGKYNTKCNRKIQHEKYNMKIQHGKYNTKIQQRITTHHIYFYFYNTHTTLTGLCNTCNTTHHATCIFKINTTQAKNTTQKIQHKSFVFFVLFFSYAFSLIFPVITWF